MRSLLTSQIETSGPFRRIHIEEMRAATAWPRSVRYVQLAACAVWLGRILWLRRKKFVGSYLFFRVTSRL